MDKSVRSSRLQDIGTFLYSAGLVAVALLGMTGIVYHCLAPNGLLGPSLGRLWSRHPVLTLLIAVGVITMLLVARSRVGSGPINTSSDTPLYVFVTIGTFFASRLILYGTL
jgi:hypothetical protein